MNRDAVIFAFLFLLASSLSVFFSITAKLPYGDWAYHIRYAELYAQGKLAMFDKELMSSNKTTYPPFFHLFLVPSVLFHIEIPFAKLFEWLAYPTALISTVYFIYKKRGIDQALIVGLILLSSMSYFDRTFQANPQSFDMIFLPLTYLFFLDKKEIPFIITSLIMIYSHGLPSLMLLAPMIFLFDKSSIKMIVITLLLASPIIFLTAEYFIPSISFHLSAELNPQQRNIREHPLSAVRYIGLTIPIFSFLIPFGYKNFDRIDKLMLVAILCLIPMIIVWPERFLEYVTIPASVLIAKQIYNSPYRKIFQVMILILALFNIYWMMSWGATFQGVNPS
jgi:hypothetical protein